MRELYAIRYELFSFIVKVTFVISSATAAELGSSCVQDSDCNVQNGRCYQQLCSCLPFYAAYNSTICLQSNMLGFECLIAEQCSKKVSNSTCIEGICRCEPGLLQFRRHTCLTAAKIGEICYNDMHCRLWDSDSHCDFMIANLFGRCLCNAPFKKSRSGACLPNMPPPSTSTIQSLDFPYPVILKNASAIRQNETDSKFQNHNKTRLKNKPNTNGMGTKPELLRDKITSSHQKPLQHTTSATTAIANAIANTSSKPHKPPMPTKLPQHFQINQIFNKTQMQSLNLSEKILNFYHSATNLQKPVKHYSTSTIKPIRINSTNHESNKITHTFSTNILPTKPSKYLNRLQNDNKTNKNNKPSATADKILVVATKKPSKNKIVLANKNDLPSSVLHNHDNGVSEDSKRPSDKVSSFLRPSHHRGAENNLSNAVSLGYNCKVDQQCKKNDNNSRCINGVCDCVIGKRKVENSCSAKNRGCHKGTFQCKSTGICISWFFVCDGRKDCTDGSDEDCQEKNICPEHAFRCGNMSPAVCISQASRCDGSTDCPNGEDEANCTATKLRGCPLHTFQCEDGRCLPEYEFCNAVISCDDGSDEPINSCTATWNSSVRNLGHCPFRCSNGRCRSSAVVCSGRDGCGDNSDENKCSVCKCPPIS